MSHVKFRIYIITFGFIAGISFPLLNEKIKLITDIQNFENRKLGKKPELNISHLDPYPSWFEIYYNDNFNLRSRLLKLHNIAKLELFNSSPIPDRVIVGKDGWLFHSGPELDSYLGRDTLTQDELEGFRKELEYRTEYLAKRNCKFYFLVVPCKISIYSEKVGNKYYRITNKSWGEQLLTYLNKNSKINTVDVFNTLRNNKSSVELYHKLDNHWNELGAFYACNGLLNRIKKDFPVVKPLKLSDFTIKRQINREGDLQKMLGNLPAFYESEVKLVPKRGFNAQTTDSKGYPCPKGFAYPWAYEMNKANKKSNKLKLFIVSDSFGNDFFPIIAEGFGSTIKLFDAWQYKLNEEVVEQEKPDIMLLMIDEPILKNFLNYRSGVLQKNN